MKSTLTFFLSFLSFFFLMAQENGGPYTPDENTVLLMHFNGDVTNSANIGNDGIEHGSGISYDVGVHGQCLRFDNSTSDKQSWIEVPFYDELNFSEEFSIECWFKINSWEDDHNKLPSLIRKGDGWPDYQIGLNNEISSLIGSMNCIDDDYSRDASVNTTEIIEAGKWYYISMYFNFTHHHLYMILRDEDFNEIYANHEYTYTKAFNSHDKLFIGFGNYGGSYFDGCIDEMRISNKYRKYRDEIVSEISISELKDSVPPLLKDKWQVYQWPLSEHFPINSETGERHKGNSCGITAILRLIHFWEHPRFPMGNLDFIENGFNWKADFDNTQYLFDEMLDVFPPGTTAEEYASAATLSAHIGATAHLPGTWIGSASASIKTILEKYFLFNKNLRFIYREEYTKEEWEKIFKNELSNGRPILIEGVAERWDNGNWAGHYYICDGFSSDNKFHSDMSMGIGQWYDIDNFDYGQNQCALIFAEPDWENKELELLTPKSGDIYQQGSELEIKWNSVNISNLIIEYSSDAGYHWHTVADNVDANTGNYSWIIPYTISDDYRIRISDKANLNVYRKSSGINVYDQKAFIFEYPKAGTNFKKGTDQPIYWQSSGIKTFRLDYLVNNSTWTTWCDSVNTKDGFIMANLPDLETNQIKLRAVDLEEPENVYESETFHLVTDQLWGGPYEKDNNTLLLMHFENEIYNEVQNQLIPNELNPIGIFEENYNKNLGRAFRIYNLNNQTADAIHVKNSENINLGNNWTIEAWVKVASIMGERTVASLIINKWDVFNIGAGWQHFGAYIAFENGTSVDFFHPQEYHLDEWYHVALVSNAAEEKISFYVHDKNYQEVYHDEKPFPHGSNGMVLNKEFINDGQDKNLVTIGGLGGGSNLELDGYLDELRITKSVVDYENMVVGVKEQLSDEVNIKLTCYPNPATSESVISFQIKNSRNLNLSVFDIHGRKITTILNKTLPAGNHNYPLGKTIPSNGIYFLRLKTEEGISTQKFVFKYK